MKNNNLLLVFGQLALAVSILLNHFAGESTLVSFLVGLFTGLSIVLNIASAVSGRKGKVT